jgi:hypothetical protein
VLRWPSRSVVEGVDRSWLPPPRRLPSRLPLRPGRARPRCGLSRTGPSGMFTWSGLAGTPRTTTFQLSQSRLRSWTASARARIPIRKTSNAERRSEVSTFESFFPFMSLKLCFLKVIW